MAKRDNKSINAEALKKETKATVNQVKDTIKNTDIKNEAKETKSFLKEMFSDPFSPLKKAAEGEKETFKKAVVLMICLIVLSLVNTIVFLIKIGGYSSVHRNVIQIVSSILNPLIDVVISAIIIFVLNKTAKKPLTSVMATLTIATVPSGINYIINIIELLFVSDISILTNPIATTLSVITIILTYVGMKTIFEIKEHKDFIKKFALITVISEFISIIVSNLLKIGL